MSKIDKLSIMGVRSFGKDKREVIQFFHPLTLIVGYNGAGKTTIIECLRYATTGELPPNSGVAGAWIHDPKLCGEKEVKAQVALSFESTKKVEMVVTRSLLLTVKKAMRSQKALDGTLTITKNGERSTTSTRVAELDQIMPQYLGVSKAILESVIFCHQDDSLWPMSQPAALKKKFDEIFEALKYTKALDNIKVLRKKQIEELGKYKLIEGHCKDDKDRGARAEKQSEKLYDEMEALRAENDQLQVKLEEAQEKSRVAYEHAAKFEKIVTELNGKRMEAQGADRIIKSLKLHMTEMTESDEELQTLQDQYEERVSLHRQESEKFRKEYQEFARQLDQNRNTLGAKHAELGRFEAEKDHYERQLESRRDLIKETSRSHGIRGFDTDINDAKVREFMERVARMAKEHNSNLDRARRETQEESRKAQQALNALNERRSAFNQAKESVKSQMSANDQRINSLQSTLDKIEIDEGGKVVLESTIQDTQQRLDKAKTEFNTAQWENRIQSTDREMKTLDEQKEKMDAELIEATRQAGDSARVDFLRKEFKDRKQSLATMTGAHGQRISEMIGMDWEPSTLDRVFKTALDTRLAAVKEAELQRDGTNRELEQVQFVINATTKELQGKHNEADQHANKIQEAVAVEPADFPDEWSTIEANYDIVKGEGVGVKAEKEYFTKCLNKAKDDDMCWMCQRTLKNDKERERLTKRLESLIQKAQEAASKTLDENAEKDYLNGKAVRPNYEAWKRLQEDIPALEQNLKEQESKREGLLAKLEQQDFVVKEKEDAKRDIESLSKTVQLISKYHAEAGNFSQQINDIEESQKSNGTTRGLETIQHDLKAVNDQIRSVNSNLTQLRADKERGQNLIHTLENETNTLSSKLATAMYQLKEKNNIEAQIKDVKHSNQQHRDAIRQADQDIEALAPHISQAQAKLEDISQRGEERVSELQLEVSKVNDALHQLKKANNETNEYIENGGPQRLSQATRVISDLEGEIERIETELRRITIEVKKIEDQLHDHAATKRGITDNLMYRENVRHLEVLQSEISELQKHNAEVDKDRYDAEGKLWQNERNKLAGEQQTIIGSLKAKDDQLAQLLKDWETDYKDAAQKYKEAHIRVETTKAAVEDLKRYSNALDNAIMKYHSLKMEEINRIIEELWRKTYQGTDVDTICIRSENETQKGNKSYNYRVVMVKQDVEMDMRGRCSAGQKVLASIIIRLALAECFGVNCGLIALDEPTTNLDRDNVRALAESLSEIIKIRRQQSNFQLIVITHDEEFLRYMKCDEFTDDYYRVARTAAQTSEIKKQRVANVM